MNRKINSLLLAFLISVQPQQTMTVNSFLGNEDVQFLANVLVRVVSMALVSGMAIYMVTWVKSRMFTSDTSFACVSVNETLNDYKGTIPESVTNLLDQLKDLQLYQDMNISITNGIIFFGDPGCGKTHLARAIAGEIRCPFFEMNATTFAQSFVGQGRTVVEKLFTQARQAARKNKHKTAIIFIDEFDSIG